MEPLSRSKAMTGSVINLREKLGNIDDYWSPRIIAQLNDYHLKLVKVEGEFVWHSHAETDEVFLVLQGSLLIETLDGAVGLEEGELYVVPAGVMHRPVANEECHLLLIEPAGTINTGDARGELPAADDQWV
jgi:mannose-6-phosphate isomerase-like protein (cupin superfamily)